MLGKFAPVAVIAAFFTIGAVFCVATSNPEPSDLLHDLFEREWQFRLQEDPLFATSVGEHQWNDQLPNESYADQERRTQATRKFLAELQTIDRAQLDTQDAINYQIFHDQLENRVAGFEYGGYQIPLNADSGFHSNFARLPKEVPLQTVQDYENYIARIEGFPKYVQQHIELMRMGLANGMVLPKVVLQGHEFTIDSHIVDDPRESVFYSPFGNFPSTFSDSQRQRLTQAGLQAIQEGIVAGYRSFSKFMADEYVPGCRETLGASELPNGQAYYQQRIRHFTTLQMTADEIHQKGLEEVARIRQEMMAVIEGVGFDGSFAEFLEFLRTDPRFYPKSAEELLMRAAYITKRMDGKLPALFKTLPRLPYGVEPVPDHLAPKYTTGRYVGAPEGSTQPGYYWVNTYNLKSRAFYTLEALSLHEAVPGHHLQIALNQELEDLPNFRRFSYLSAFGEGWGLYSEWLGLEAGFYTDPYSNFGRLTYEMWRACRLVVDTGVHAMGWTRDQMMEFLATNTALPLHEITTETDRYISWPAQALAYKIGELKIKELRRRAEDALGEHFDVREFHDRVLGNGSVPLKVLEEIIDRFIADKLAAIHKAEASPAIPSTDIYLVEINTSVIPWSHGEPVNATNRDGYDNQPAFLPDGSGFLYTSIRQDGQADIYHYTVQSRGIRRITDTQVSEYSATPLLQGSGFSTVRVDEDGKQKLWAYSDNGSEVATLMPNLEPVGYHAWLDSETLVLFVLGEPHTLHLANLRSGESRVVAQAIGRSLHRMPEERAAIFVHKRTKDDWDITIYNVESDTTRHVMPAQTGQEDFTWTPDHRILMAEGSKLFIADPSAEDPQWLEVLDLGSNGIGPITRLAMSPDGKRLALVAPGSEAE